MYVNNDIQLARRRNVADGKLARLTCNSLLLQTDRRVDITNVNTQKMVQFSYSVEWYEEPNLLWKDRLTDSRPLKFAAIDYQFNFFLFF
jgi:hypothetical protein